MRDVLFLPLDEEEELVISTDCSAAIGAKEADIVHVPYETVSYFGARVALMELMSVGANPIAVVLHNFVDDQAWDSLCTGICQVFDELDLTLPITGSTESNFPTIQSAVGFTVIGKVSKAHKRIGKTPDDAKFAVIGEPLVGDEVIKRRNRILPLSLFRQLLHVPEIYELVPVGSKGILYELNGLLAENGLEASRFSCSLPLHKSSGPATSVLISFHPDAERKIKQLANGYFFPVEIIS
jgi:hypothetical protein